MRMRMKYENEMKVKRMRAVGKWLFETGARWWSDWASSSIMK